MLHPPLIGRAFGKKDGKTERRKEITALSLKNDQISSKYTPRVASTPPEAIR